MTPQAGQAERGGPRQIVRVRLRPRRGLLAALAVAFAAWIGFLAFAYARTVYPQRHPPATAPAKP